MNRLLCALILFAPMALNAQCFIGYGDSMRPALMPAQHVYVSRAAYVDLKPDDMVAFTHDQDIVVSRLIVLTPDGWTTKGDTNAQNDDVPMTKRLFVGVVSAGAERDVEVRADKDDYYVLYPEPYAWDMPISTSYAEIGIWAYVPIGCGPIECGSDRPCHALTHMPDDIHDLPCPHTPNNMPPESHKVPDGAPTVGLLSFGFAILCAYRRVNP